MLELPRWLGVCSSAHFIFIHILFIFLAWENLNFLAKMPIKSALLNAFLNVIQMSPDSILTLHIKVCSWYVKGSLNSYWNLHLCYAKSGSCRSLLRSSNFSGRFGKVAFSGQALSPQTSAGGHQVWFSHFELNFWYWAEDTSTIYQYSYLQIIL